MVAARVNAERVVLLGWSRAILLQLAHPLVAQGVNDHSSFRGGRFTAAVRLHHTVRAMLALAFGGPSGRDAALARINAIHRSIHGVLPHAVGPYPAGTRYSAEDSDLLLWVHATLLDSVPLVYERFVAPLTPAERDRYCAEAAEIAIALGVRERDVPMSRRSLEAYLERMYASGAIVVGETARQLGATVLSPPLARLIAPAAALNRVITIALLPASIRDQYGFSWSPRQERAAARWTRVVRRARALAPDWLALWPEARRRS